MSAFEDKLRSASQSVRSAYENYVKPIEQLTHPSFQFKLTKSPDSPVISLDAGVGPTFAATRLPGIRAGGNVRFDDVDTHARIHAHKDLTGTNPKTVLSFYGRQDFSSFYGSPFTAEVFVTNSNNSRDTRGLDANAPGVKARAQVSVPLLTLFTPAAGPLKPRILVSPVTGVDVSSAGTKMFIGIDAAVKPFPDRFPNVQAACTATTSSHYCGVRLGLGR